MRRLGVLAVLAVAMAGCGEREGPIEPTVLGEAARADETSHHDEGRIERAREKLREADLAHAAASGSLPDGFLAHLTEDAVFLFPNAPYVQGKDAISELLSAPPAPFVPGIGLSWTPVFVDVSVDAKVGYSFGNVEITRPGLTPLRGQYIAFWRKVQGGWTVEAWNMSPAFFPPGPLPSDFGEALLASGGHRFHPVDMARETRRLLNVDAAFSRASVELGQAAGFRKYANKHAIVLAGGNPDFIIGREEIAASREGAIGTLSWTPTLGAVGPRGDLGWTVGNFFSQAEGQAFHGKYMTVWQKEKTGAWKFVQDGGSGNPPPGP
jgi:ketosteroid isomerase-like protein